jgi:uncharacterized protein YkwD
VRRLVLPMLLLVAAAAAVFDLRVADDSWLRAQVEASEEAREQQQTERDARAQADADERREDSLAQQRAERTEQALEHLGDDPVATVVDQINTSRVEHGLAPVARHRGADEVAQRWSDHVADVEELYHNPDRMQQLRERVDGLVGEGENVGMRQPDLPTMHQGFMDSPPHRANILNPRWTHVGVGVALDEVGFLWMTHNFVEVR